MQEMLVWSLGREDPLEKEMATHSSILAWEIPWTEEPGRLQSMGSQKSWTWLSTQHTHKIKSRYNHRNKTKRMTALHFVWTRVVGEMYAHLSYHFHMLISVSWILPTCKPAHQWMPCWTVLHLRMQYPLVLHIPCRHRISRGNFSVWSSQQLGAVSPFLS